MAEEVERKSLATGHGWRERVKRSASLRQGFLGQTDAAVIRIWIVDDAEALVTIKWAKAELVRGEFEYPVPLADAEQLLELCTGAVIEKAAPLGGRGRPHVRNRRVHRRSRGAGARRDRATPRQGVFRAAGLARRRGHGRSASLQRQPRSQPRSRPKRDRRVDQVPATGSPS
jgi:hypothetical protein